MGGVTDMTTDDMRGRMILRICDGERERITPASIEVVEQAFASEAAIRIGTEISLVEGDCWLVALAIGASEAPTGRGTEEFLLTSANGNDAAMTGPVGRREVLQRFREFVRASVAELHEHCNRRSA
jgi:hypothetical protein